MTTQDAPRITASASANSISRMPAGVRSALLRADLEHAAAMAADPTIPVGSRREWAAIRDELAAYLTATLARDRLTERVGPANALKALQVLLDLGWSPPGRMSTPDRPTPDGGRVVTMKRACGGCGRTLGDATELELHLAVNGEPLSDVRTECGCTP